MIPLHSIIFAKLAGIFYFPNFIADLFSSIYFLTLVSPGIAVGRSEYPSPAPQKKIEPINLRIVAE
jgi:hypothetical protein